MYAPHGYWPATPGWKRPGASLGDAILNAILDHKDDAKAAAAAVRRLTAFHANIEEHEPVPVFHPESAEMVASYLKRVFMTLWPDKPNEPPPKP
jgi:hypothetical protein